MKKYLWYTWRTAVLCTLLQFFVVGVLAQAGPDVSIEAPAEVSTDGDFVARVAITEVTGFDACQFDFSYDPNLLEVTDVTAGYIGGISISIDMWGEVAPGRIRIIGNVPGISEVDGSGYLAEIHFHVVGTFDGRTELQLSNGLLADKNADRIAPVTWRDDSVRLSAASDPASSTSTSPPSSVTPVPSTSTPVPDTSTRTPTLSRTANPPSATPVHTLAPTHTPATAQSAQTTVSPSPEPSATGATAKATSENADDQTPMSTEAPRPTATDTLPPPTPTHADRSEPTTRGSTPAATTEGDPPLGRSPILTYTLIVLALAVVGVLIWLYTRRPTNQ